MISTNQEFINKIHTANSVGNIKHAYIMLVKVKSIEHLDSCKGCIFHNEEEKMDCSLIGSPMSCVVDMHYNYVWKNVDEINGEDIK